jgi:hypothetical protein
MRRFVASLALSSMVILLGAAGCELIVPKDLPAFSCAPGAANACPSGEICSPAGVCVSSCPQTRCGADLVCDTISHLCVPKIDLPESGPTDDGGTDSTVPADAPADSPPPFEGGADTGCTKDLGCNCTTNASCNADLFCGSDSVLGDAVKNTGPLCTKPCCKSEDCPPDFVCYGPGTGGTYCVHPELLQRLSANGASPGGTSCVTGESCRSGVCAGTVKVCTDACCSDADCVTTVGAVCRRTYVEGHNLFACAVPPGGTFGNDSACSLGSDCTSGLCAVNSGGFGECKPHGCGKASCLAKTYGTCNYLQTSGAPEYLGTCLHNAETPGGSPGTGAVGAPCDPTKTVTSDCKTSFCDAVTKLCTDVCCVDADCAPYPGTKCRPASNPHYLTCQ